MIYHLSDHKMLGCSSCSSPLTIVFFSLSLLFGIVVVRAWVAPSINNWKTDAAKDFWDFFFFLVFPINHISLRRRTFRPIGKGRLSHWGMFFSPILLRRNMVISFTFFRVVAQPCSLLAVLLLPRSQSLYISVTFFFSFSFLFVRKRGCVFLSSSFMLLLLPIR